MSGPVEVLLAAKGPAVAEGGDSMRPPIVAWLLEQIAEDERRARAAIPGPWKFVHGYLGLSQQSGVTLKRDLDSATIGYLTGLAPERVLAECDAKRRVIRWVLTWPWRPPPPSSVDGLLELLALPYADRPGYREEWRP